MKEIIEFARKLRKESTTDENKLWFLLQGRRFRGYKFRRQVLIGQYFVDFCCYKERLVLELDGGNHRKMENKLYDIERTKYLNNQGFSVVRLWNSELEKPSLVVNKISEALSTPHLSARLKSSK